MSTAHVLLLGGHGKVSLLMTTAMLSRSWHVTSLIRNSEHRAEIESKGKDQPGKIDALVESLENVTSVEKAQGVLDQVKPDYVVWSAGAGGQGGAARTYAIDRDAARYYITAAVQTPSIKKFLMVSYIGSRQNRAPWFTDEDWEYTQMVNNEVLPDYAKAKLDADECLVALAKQRRDKGHAFQDIVLRPGHLTDDPPLGKVTLGYTRGKGEVSRADVADVAVKLLETDYRGYLDLLAGEESIDEAIVRVRKDKIDAFKGEDEQAILEKYSL